MRTKYLKFLGVAAFFAVALFVNASVNTDKGSQDVTLTDLANATEANAECPSSSFNNGKCGISNICFWGRGDASGYDCDTTRG